MGFEKIIGFCKKAAYYVNANEVDGLILAIKKIIIDDNLRKNLIEIGYQRIFKNFSWKISAKKHEEVFLR